MDQPKLTIVPISLKLANEYISKWHRHHKKVQGHRFSIAVQDQEGIIRGVMCVGRPVSRYLDDGMTCEVTRLATDGTPNACSCLYAAARRAVKELGYKRLLTYILEDEPGTSLKAAGWKLDGISPGGEWSCKSRPRENDGKYPTVPKQRWVAVL